MAHFCQEIMVGRLNNCQEEIHVYEKRKKISREKCVWEEYKNGAV